MRRDLDGTSNLAHQIYVEQPRTFATLDHPATRAIHYLAHRLLVRLERTARKLSAVKHSARAQELAQLTREGIVEIQKLRRTPPLRDAPGEPPNAAAVQAIIDHPDYSRSYRLLRRLLDPGLRLAESRDFEANLRFSYDLFELLVLYRLISELQAELDEGWSLEADDAPAARAGVLADPRTGRIWRATRRETGERLELHYQRTFGAWAEEANEFQSLTGERRPDYVLLLKRSGEPVAWLLLDAKYRSCRGAIHQALEELHAYRDSLRWNGRRATAAYILVPALAQDAACYGDPRYHATQSFGALIVQSSGWVKTLLAPMGLTRRLAEEVETVETK